MSNGITRALAVAALAGLAACSPQEPGPSAQAPAWVRAQPAAPRPEAATLGFGEDGALDALAARRFRRAPEHGSPESVSFRPATFEAVASPSLQARECLAAAVYYEAAREPLEGQRAVAQVVLNRVRDPHYPKTVCGVVYQGWRRATGCQFSFSCDGSLARHPAAALWSRAEEVAAEALDGYVAPGLDAAVNYHADYVAPYWKRSVIRIAQIGRHLFYRRREPGDTLLDVMADQPTAAAGAGAP